MRGNALIWCSKSWIKGTRTRIDVIRRKRDATQKFLKKDVADLLANGLDINAFGRVSCCLVCMLWAFFVLCQFLFKQQGKWF